MPFVRSRYQGQTTSRWSALVGNLGGATAVSFLYTLNVNMGRDGSGNMVQWADAIRGYQGTPPVLTVPAGATAPTYDAVKGAVSTSTSCAMMAALSGAFSVSAGTTAGGITKQAIGTIWVVGELDANPTTTQMLYATQNSAAVPGCAIAASNTVPGYQAMGRSGLAATSTVTATDSVCRLIIATVVSGTTVGCQIPNGGALITAANGPSAISEPYGLTLFAELTLAGAVTNGGIGSIREIGGLNRIATAADIALLKTNATTLGATL